MNEFNNKTILVTGGSSGIGKTVARKFLENGGRVIVFDKAKPDYEIEFYEVDISNEEAISNSISNIKDLDILVNCAGIYKQSFVEDTTKRELDLVIDINLKGTYLMCKHALPFIKRNKGNIVNVSSCLGIIPESEAPAYCATKAGINMLTKCLAQQYASEGIRINAVLPGPIDTPLLEVYFDSPESLKSHGEKKPLKRVGTPEEVAEVILFLTSEKASFVTGALYTVDGGESSFSIYAK